MKTPRRIASLISSATEMLYLLGLGDQVVGVSHECDYPADVKGKPRLTRSLVEATASSRDIDDQVRALSRQQSALYMVDAEQLAELAPDLIITQSQCDVCAVRYEDVVSAVKSSPALKHTEVLALNPSRLTDVLRDIERIGAAADASDRAIQVVTELSARVSAVRAVTDALTSEAHPRVACLEWIEPPMLAANWMPEIIGWAGGNPGQTASGAHSSYATWQEIAAFNPQVIVIMPCGFDLRRAIIEAQVLPGIPGWSKLSAVQAGRVYAVDGNAYFNRSGPRLVDSLEILAHLLHPTKFAPGPPGTWCRLETRGGALVEVST